MNESMEYLVTQGPKPALKLIKDIANIVGPPTGDETEEQSAAKGARAKDILQEKLNDMSVEEVAILHASLASLCGISESFYIMVVGHFSSLGRTATNMWKRL